MERLLSTIKQRAKEYRCLPFWSWNDKLEDDVLAWQIREMAKVGCGGYFMHARGGIETDYLADEWFHRIKVGVEQGIEEGLKPWVYDECGWPSGFAGGEVTAKGERYHAKGLRIKYIEKVDEEVSIPNLLGIYSLNEEEGTICKVEDHQGDEGQLLAIYYSVCSDYIDILNKEVVGYFLECTHEKYYERFEDKFGKGIQGFFTDEPRISEGDIPWSYEFEKIFENRYKYDIVACLPALFIECKGYEKIRYDFWALVNELFVEAFMKQIYDWCEEHGCELTGHVMMEESLYSQMTGTSGSMPFYEYMHIPGVDWLRRTIGNSIMAKQVASVADQLGKLKVLTESFALCGWNVTLEELKWIAEWQFTNGVNLVCQHLEGYTLRGLRKRDYPPSLFYQQNWWEEYKDFNDYLARLGATLTEGKKVVDVLIIHPMQSAWIAYDGSNSEKLKQLDNNLIAVTDLLVEQHVDYHFGDETLIKKYGEVTNGSLKIGKCDYHTVILPSLYTLTPHTVSLLQAFCEQGGTIICQGGFPKLCNGVATEILESLKAQTIRIETIDSFKHFIGDYKKDSGNDISIKQDQEEIPSIRYMERNVNGKRLFFMLNLDKEESYLANITLKGAYSLKRLNIEREMEVIPCETSWEKETTSLNLAFEPMQSYILVAGERAELEESKGAKQEQQINNIPMNRGEWKIKESTPNAMTLDRCKYRIDGGQWEEEIAVIHLMKKLLELKRPCHIEMDFRFNLDVESTSINNCELVAEEISKFNIKVNDQPLLEKENGWWKDTSFRKIPINKYLKQGENHIYMSREFYQSPKVYHVLFDEGVYETEINQLTYDVELESIYLIGEFGVISESEYEELPRDGMRTEGPFRLTKMPQLLKAGDFTRQGLCFFSGKLVLGREIELAENEGKRVVLNFEGIKAPVFKVYVNGELVDKRMWAPFEVDVTDYIKEGSNSLELEIYSSNRNLLGPHHHIDGEVYNVGPLSFSGEWSWCERPTEGVEINDEDRHKSYWHNGYCFVKFGLIEC